MKRRDVHAIATRTRTRGCGLDTRGTCQLARAHWTERTIRLWNKVRRERSALQPQTGFVSSA